MVFFTKKKKKKAETGIQKIWFGALVTLDASSDAPYAWKGDPRLLPLLRAWIPEEEEDHVMENRPPSILAFPSARPRGTGKTNFPVIDLRGGARGSRRGGSRPRVGPTSRGVRCDTSNY